MLPVRVRTAVPVKTVLLHREMPGICLLFVFGPVDGAESEFRDDAVVFGPGLEVQRAPHPRVGSPEGAYAVESRAPREQRRLCAGTLFEGFLDPLNDSKPSVGQ
jgi:hypothetical protein